tara:strand:+ start:1821 stop:3437 length:1617 start_codon:yes stop_codon:yes gene_type:complete
MHIGLDFDNTIASYDALFIFVASELGLVEKNSKLNKTELRDFIKELSDGEELWMKLQGQVYGRYMHRAKLMPGIKNFLLRCKLRKIDVCIVSHKTEYGHFDDENISLRKEALAWMTKLNFFNNDSMPLSLDKIYFAETRQEKVDKIKELNFDFFVDDLVEVFNEKDFPKHVKKILFNKEKQAKNGMIAFDNWPDIDAYILGEETFNDIKSITTNMLNMVPDSVIRVKGQGNSRVYRLNFKESSYALKRYPDLLNDPRPRLETEFNALSLLHDNSIKNLPKPEARDTDLNIGIYSWLGGNSFDLIEDNHIDKCLEFVVNLKELSEKKSISFTLDASEACFSIKELINQIQGRLDNFVENNTEKELLDFLNNHFEPKFTSLLQLINKSYTNYFIGDDLDKNLQILSPSDFGFHNALINSEEEINFLDFDYFGWDDPVKLTSDFYWHPAMKLSNLQKNKWLESMKDLFSGSDINFKDRLDLSLPLYGLRWVLIILNEFNLNHRKRRMHAKFNASFDWKKKEKQQLNKAIALFSIINVMEVC